MTTEKELSKLSDKELKASLAAARRKTKACVKRYEELLIQQANEARREADVYAELDAQCERALAGGGYGSTGPWRYVNSWSWERESAPEFTQEECSEVAEYSYIDE